MLAQMLSLNFTLMNSRSTNQYRPDIDGLRAVAVISVIIFHLGLNWLPGGFVGVDVFFVISGYLITNILIKELQQTGRIKYANFYIRRFRRLFPALLVTVFCTIVIGTIIFPPDYMQSLGGSAVAAIFSFSNFYFWTQSGYFDVSNHMKPLLHIWSLSLEEQFYFIWPLFIVVAFRWFKEGWGWMAIAVAIASFVANLFWAHDQTTIFYLLPFRAFELAIGGSLVWLEARRPVAASGADAAFLGGLALIVWSTINLTESVVFPSYNALYPCIGAALTIYGGASARTSIIVANPLLAGIGKLSYSLYLVHWPICVLTPYWVLSKVDTSMRLWMAMSIVVAAVLLFFLVETPFRRPREGAVHARSGKFAGFTALLALAVTIPALSAWASQGWQWRYSPAVLQFMDESNLSAGIENPLNGCLKSRDQGIGDIPETCFTPDSNDQRPTILLVGDSTANHLVVGFLASLGDRYQIKIWASSSCAPLLGDHFPTEGRCDENNHYFFDHLIHQHTYSLVVFSANNAAPAFEESFVDGERVLRELGIDYVVVGQMPTYLDRPLFIAARYGNANLAEAMRNKMDIPCEGEHGLDALISKDHFFSAKEALCQGSYPTYEVDGRLVQSDTLHLSDFGSIYMGKKFATWAESVGRLPK